MSDETTWGEVCRKVGFSDNLYKDCRKNVPGFMGGGMSNRSFDEVPEDDDYGPDSKGFAKQLRDSALEIPPPPSSDWKDEDGGFFSMFPIQKILMYGGVAGLLWFFVMKNRPQEVIGTTGTAPQKLPSSKAA